MHLYSHLLGFVVCCHLAIAAPVVEPVPVDASLRLIKTSETDPGSWVTEEQKVTDYVANGIGFVDITDIAVRGSLSMYELGLIPNSNLGRGSSRTTLLLYFK